MDSAIVIDLDETLVHSSECPIRDPHYSFDTSGGDGGEICGRFRPGVSRFLDQAHETFTRVFIWSAGVGPYVEKIVDLLYSGTTRPRPSLVCSRKHCTYEEGFYHKPIESLHYLYHGDLPIRSRILVIDDNPHTFLDNPANGLLIPGFSPYVSPLYPIDSSLDELSDWISDNHDAINNGADISLLPKNKIFSR